MVNGREPQMDWQGRRCRALQALNLPPTHASDLPPQAPSLDDDEGGFDTDHDEASRDLLSGTHGPSYSTRYLEPVGSRINMVLTDICPNVLFDLP